MHVLSLFPHSVQTRKTPDKPGLSLKYFCLEFSVKKIDAVDLKIEVRS